MRGCRHAGRILAGLALMWTVPAPAFAPSPGLAAEQPAELRWRDQRVSVRPETASGARRDYKFTTTPDAGNRSLRSVSEASDQPYLRSSNALFDGLFALAIAEAGEDSVAQIQDSAFNDGKPIECRCFETGEKWHYVWTRDISYAVDLGLTYLDPQRALNSLLFKTSEVRPELREPGEIQWLAAQDTGSGGSWPVSTDRVVWILAASDVLAYVAGSEHRAGSERVALTRRIYAIARDTVEQEHRYAYDAPVGLYRGETSFLDWREQSYPEWTRNDVLFIAGGYAFSTNVLHYIALRRTSDMARRMGDPKARRYRVWADDLKRAVNQKFWQQSAGMYRSFLGPPPEFLPSNSYDLLGLSLAIIHGIAEPRQARQILKNYPISKAGPPVLWPQQAGIPIYHNRALWPFVTAYALRAAKIVRNNELASELAESLMRGSALSQSNMENFEFLTQAATFDDGALSGPVINSRRQLWSIAGYLSMVLDSLWGVKLEGDNLIVEPWLPSRLAHSLFSGRRELSLHGLRLADTVFDIMLVLPPGWASNGALEAGTLSLNGRRVKGTRVSLLKLRPHEVNTIEVTMRPVAAPVQGLTMLSFTDSHLLTPRQRRSLIAPPAPALLSASRENRDISLSWAGIEPHAFVQVYRNGRQIQTHAAGIDFQDRSIPGSGAQCYSLTQRYADTGLTSLGSRAICVAEPGMSTLFTVAEHSIRPNDGTQVSVIGDVAQYADWGRPGQELRIDYAAPASGLHWFRLRYQNVHGPINTGITAAVKSITARCSGGGAEQLGTLVMPHLARPDTWGDSTGFFFRAKRKERCELGIADGFNMSYLSHFALYTGGEGGKSGALNRAAIQSAQIDVLR